MRRLAVVLLLALTGCALPHLPSAGTTEDIARELRYFKDPAHGLCYAALSTSTYMSFDVISITAIPCAQVGL